MLPPTLHRTDADDVRAVQESSSEPEAIPISSAKAPQPKITPLAKPITSAGDALAMQDLLYGTGVSHNWNHQRESMIKAIDKVIRDHQPRIMPDMIQWREYSRWLHEAHRWCALDNNSALFKAVNKAAGEVKPSTGLVKFWCYDTIDDEDSQQQDQAIAEEGEAPEDQVVEE